MLEVLSPAGSSDALVAAVRCGADAVYLGCGAFNARMNAKNFTEEQLYGCVSYCHIRGVKVYLTLNTLALDRELKSVAQTVLTANQAGVDAILVQDLGVAQLVRQLAPDMPIHASTQMAVHNLEGVKKAAQMGVTRVVLARELSQKQIAAICRKSPVEVEVFVHGALCMCYSGQCYLSALIGRRSGNRGQCAQPCRMTYGYDRHENRYPLSLRDNCLVQYLQELQRMGVACIKIEGRMKRAEYVALATKIYKDASLGRPVTAEQLAQLSRIFSRQGFTDGYYTGKKGSHMFGAHQDDAPDRKLLSRIRLTYENTETPRVPVKLRIQVRRGCPAALTGVDDRGNWATVQGAVPEIAVTRSLSGGELLQRLSRTGGTPYYIADAGVELDPGLSLSASAINALRRDVLSRLSALRGQPQVRQTGSFVQPPRYSSYRGKPVFSVSIQALEQITPALLQFCPAVLYIPLHLLTSGAPAVETACRKLRVCAMLPRVISDGEWDGIFRQLAQVRRLGVQEALVGNLGMLDAVRRTGFEIRGDFGLNVFNSGTANFLATQGLISQTASFELTLPQIRDLSKPLATEMIAYGRLPLMITENCVIHNRTGTCTCGSGACALVDRTGSRFPVIRDGGTCRTVILNSRKLYLGDRLSALSELGLWALRLSFTTEQSRQVDMVLQDYAQGAAFDPGTGTRGLYLRGVE